MTGLVLVSERDKDLKVNAADVAQLRWYKLQRRQGERSNLGLDKVEALVGDTLLRGAVSSGDRRGGDIQKRI